MHCLQFLPRSSAPTLRFLGPNPRTQIPSSGILSVQLHTTVGLVNAYRLMAPVDRRGDHVANANSSSASSTEKGDGSHKVQEEKSEIYSNNMTQAMGAVLTYRHELGMNYNFILPDLIVGSCLQTPGDVDKLRKIGVKTIFCLQQDSDLEYFRVDIRAIQEYANNCGDITHCRAEIRDFDAFDLRMRLPAVVSKLYQAIKQNGGVTYIHCTAGLGRAPAVAKEDTISNNVVLSRNVSIGVIFPQELELCSRRRLVADIIALLNMLAYMFWVRGYKLIEANKLLQSKRACFPKLEAIKSATADILTGISKSRITLIWEGDNCSSVEVSGLDIGWGQRIPLELDREQGLWVLERDLPVGRYEYKYIIDGKWTCNKYELITSPNSDGHVNNYVNVYNHHSTIATRKLQKRLAGADVDLTEEERQMIREFLESFSET